MTVARKVLGDSIQHGVVPYLNERVSFDQNSGSKSNGTGSFRKLDSKILVHPWRLSFFPRNLEIPDLAFLPVYESVSVPLVVKRYKMAAGRHYNGCKTICHSSIETFINSLSFTKTLALAFLEITDWPLRIFSGHLPGVHNLPREMFASFLAQENNTSVGRSGKYFE